MIATILLDVTQTANASGTEVLTVSWQTIASIVAPIVTAGVIVVRWMMARLDANSQALQDAIIALRKAVDSASDRNAADAIARDQMVQTQQRIVWAQERILALLESDLKIASKAAQERA
jgi:hypothetical protein